MSSQLKEFTSSIINSFLGPNKNNKVLIQDDKVCISRCALYSFQNTDSQDPISSLVEETLCSHHDLYGCSTLSLLAMWYLWSEEFRVLLEEGYNIRDVIRYSQNVLELLISALYDTTINLDRLFFKKHDSVKILGKTQVKKTLDQVPISIRYSSRHFSPSQKLLDFENVHDCEPEEDCLKNIIHSLDHDEDPDICSLLLECWKRQRPSSSSSQLKADGLFICPIILPHSNSTIADGLVIKSKLNQSWCQDRKNNNSNRSLVVNGSVTYEYAHLGFSPKIAISVKQTSAINKKEVWVEKICGVIKQMNLNALLIKDDIDSEISSFCLSHSVFVVSHIPLKAFKILCNALHYSPCTYMVDCKEENIIKNLNIQNWKPKNDTILNDQYFLINVHSESILQTIVLCHPCEAVLQKTKHQINHLISRLNLLFKNNSLLPGGGKSEEWCCEFLRKQPQFHNLSDPASRIMKALANGFQNYSAIVSKKLSLSNKKASTILDETSSKLSAWHSSLSLVLLTLQCDSIIINDFCDLKKKGTTAMYVNTL